MDTRTHTPTPWLISEKYKTDVVVPINVYGTKMNQTIARTINNDANAALIVRAVNSHDALVAALEFLLADLNSEIDHEAGLIARAALSRARGE